MTWTKGRGQLWARFRNTYTLQQQCGSSGWLECDIKFENRGGSASQIGLLEELRIFQGSVDTGATMEV